MKKSQKNTTCIISLGLDFTFEATIGPRLELVMRQQGRSALSKSLYILQ